MGIDIDDFECLKRFIGKDSWLVTLNEKKGDVLVH